MSLPRLRPLRRFTRHLRRSRVSVASAAQETVVWTPAPLVKVSPAAESLFHIAVDVSEAPELASSYTRAGQYLQIRLKDPSIRPAFLAIASPPAIAASEGVFEFLVKSVAGSTAELLCRLTKGEIVDLTPATGKGFDVDQISPPENFPTVLIFATGSGISPIRALIETGFDADKRSDVRLYYGARNLTRMAYQERFNDWRSSGVDIVPVFSQPDIFWLGEKGYVQAAFGRDKRIISPHSTAAVLCGQKQMAEEVSSILVGDGVAIDKILKNF
ncbi:hypothetical protein M569_02710 [Genlisea aurea]|uniref:FAD-binding FR-type domain-containing protein n=1 Tax=Genlisea aurea TaxID=192259 RepID=S8EH85_9LAMI|nr:hypothetical protein M569_02710 [Genlisea aurea]